jgi:hypothetical protein
MKTHTDTTRLQLMVLAGAFAGTAALAATPAMALAHTSRSPRHGAFSQAGTTPAADRARDALRHGATLRPDGFNGSSSFGADRDHARPRSTSLPHTRRGPPPDRRVPRMGGRDPP